MDFALFWHLLLILVGNAIRNRNKMYESNYPYSWYAFHLIMPILSKIHVKELVLVNFSFLEEIDRPEYSLYSDLLHLSHSIHCRIILTR